MGHPAVAVEEVLVLRLRDAALARALTGIFLRSTFFLPGVVNNMLDYFTIFTVGGLVLWSQEWTKLRGAPVNDLIKTVFLEVSF